MRKSNEVVPIYSIGFVCEGEKTEPYFVKALYDKVKDSTTHSVTIVVHPVPVDTDAVTEHGSRRRKNVVSPVNLKNPDPLVTKYQSLPKPTNWVMAGEELLSSCDEVWVLFDKDGHPDMHNAFAKVAQLKAQNRRFNIVFSSRCFEHYMLLHYELNYTAFEKSECNRKENYKTVYADCQLPEAKEWGCDGSLCINGYARKKEYWKKSKDENAFEQCRNLWWGILNSFHVKWHSLCTEPITKAVYERNPYLNIYQMTLRMIEIVSLEPFMSIKIDKGNYQYNLLSRVGNVLHFECHSIFSIKNLSLNVYELPSVDELNTMSDDERQIYERTPVKHSISLNLTQGKCTDVDLTALITSPQQYAKMEWGGIVYFIASLQFPLPEMTPSQVEALQLISVTEDMVNAR